MASADERWIVTGGAGFIGANLVRHLQQVEPDVPVVIIDKLTYAGNPAALAGVIDGNRVRLEQVDIADADAVWRVFDEVRPTGVFHLAAESHVDRSIDGPAPFIHSNIVGTYVLLEAARRLQASGSPTRFLHVSTDEVFGSLGDDGMFTEQTPYDPSSPYSASKAASDHLVRAWSRTFGLDVVLTNCSNNFGPWQFPEKLIPVVIRSIRDERPIPVYGDGRNIRDWLFVGDHCSALYAVMRRGAPGRSYNVGSRNERTNVDLVGLLCDAADVELGRKVSSRRLIEYVKDRPGHDRRYAIDPTRIEDELQWRPEQSFDEALRLTVRWYLHNLQAVWGV
jgi:dTDP-glucose 4,6-dehydratase